MRTERLQEYDDIVTRSTSEREFVDITGDIDRFSTDRISWGDRAADRLGSDADRLQSHRELTPVAGACAAHANLIAAAGVRAVPARSDRGVWHIAVAADLREYVVGREIDQL